MNKRPTLVIYWADTRRLLSHRERRDLEFGGTIVSVTPNEVLLENPLTGRKVVVRGTLDAHAPKIPEPAEGYEG